MSLSYLILFPMESVSLNIIPILCVMLCMVEFLSILLLNRVERLQELSSKSEPFDDSKAQVVKKNQDFELPCTSDENKEDGNICREDVEVVMERLGIFCHPKGERIQERLDSEEVSRLFEEKEPSLEEVKGAFDVFDENGDGFIDADELQRTLCVLGFKEGAEVENCRRMIGSFDENGDGRIDFCEFVKFMENSFC